MPAQKTFSQFPNNTGKTLHELSLQLYGEQQKRWKLLADGVSALQDVQIRIVDCGSYSVTLQYNPKRIISTNAKVDSASIKERKCFLCVDNLPEEQQGVLYNEKFLILCNPMPIFKEHFTISHIAHIPQSIEEQILTFLSLTKDLSPAYSVFYNGPKCGASAPDHMHFQASPKGSIPVENEAFQHKKNTTTSGSVRISSLEQYGRSVIVLEGENEHEMELTFLRLTAAMRKRMNTNEEPMMNVIGSYEKGMWRLIVFIRSKHRPAVFFKDGEEKVLISPAAVDIGGLVVTPMEKDFRSVNSEMIKNIFEEVSVSGETLTSIIKTI